MPPAPPAAPCPRGGLLAPFAPREPASGCPGGCGQTWSIAVRSLCEAQGRGTGNVTFKETMIALSPSAVWGHISHASFLKKQFYLAQQRKCVCPDLTLFFKVSSANEIPQP